MLRLPESRVPFMATPQLLAMWTPSFPELLVLLVLALLLFGKRLPEVARSLGKGIVEFKKGVKGIEDDVEGAAKSGGKDGHDE